MGVGRVAGGSFVGGWEREVEVDSDELFCGAGRTPALN